MTTLSITFPISLRASTKAWDEEQRRESKKRRRSRESDARLACFDGLLERLLGRRDELE